MKNLTNIIVICLFIAGYRSFGQDKILPSNPIFHAEMEQKINQNYLLPIGKSSIKGSYPLGISDQKTIHIVFPSQIKEVDAGTADVSVQITESFNNVLKVKSTCKKECIETNLTILTADGGLYSFLTNYQQNPEILNININNNKNADIQTANQLGINYLMQNKFLEKETNHSEALISFLLKEVITKPDFIRKAGDKNMDISARLKGIYLVNGLLFCKFDLQNKSEIDYNIDFIKMYIKDKKALKRLAAQEEEIKIMQQYPTNNQVLAEKNAVISIATNLQTISADKELIIEIYEKNGGRHLRFKVDAKMVADAKSL